MPACHVSRLTSGKSGMTRERSTMIVITTCQTQASLRFPPSAMTADGSHRATD